MDSFLKNRNSPSRCPIRLSIFHSFLRACAFVFLSLDLAGFGMMSGNSELALWDRVTSRFLPVTHATNDSPPSHLFDAFGGGKGLDIDEMTADPVFLDWVCCDSNPLFQQHKFCCCNLLNLNSFKFKFIVLVAVVLTSVSLNLRSRLLIKYVDLTYLAKEAWKNCNENVSDTCTKTRMPH